jgi:large subunit ribosomal protein L14
MIQAQTILNVADNSGAKKLRVIKVLGGSRRRYARIGDIVTASVIEAEPRKEVRKKQVVRAVIVRQKQPFRRKDGSLVRFDSNDAVLVDGYNLKGNRIFGPIPRDLKDKRFKNIVSLAKEVV